MKTIEESRSHPHPDRAALRPRDVRPEALGALAEDVFEDAEPLGVLLVHEGARHSGGDGGRRLSPLAKKRGRPVEEGAELLVKVGNYRRNILLPDALARLSAAGASFEEGR